MESLPFLIFLGLILGILSHLIKRARHKKNGDTSTRQTDEPSTDLTIFYRLTDQLQEFFNTTAHPQDLLNDRRFTAAVQILTDVALPNQTLIEYAGGGNPLISCVAYEALDRRGLQESEIDLLIAGIGSRAPWSMYFAFRAIHHHTRSPVLGRTLAQILPWWLENTYVAQVFQPFITLRVESGEKITFNDTLSGMDRNRVSLLESFLNQLNREELRALSAELSAHSANLIDLAFLNSFGRVWDRSDTVQPVYTNEQLSLYMEKVKETLFRTPPRSVLLLGEPGVGKTTLISLLSRDIHRTDWQIFEANASDVLAGQIYIGQLEERLQLLARNLNIQKQIIWLVPNFHELYYAGRSQYNPTGILDRLLPEIERGEILIIGETTPAAFELLNRQNKRFGMIMETIRISPAGDQQTQDIALRWARDQGTCEDGSLIITEHIAREALNLSRQFLGDKESPGNLLDLLKLTRRSMLSGEGPPCKMTIDDLYRTLSHLTGLPRSILDEKEGLDLGGLRNLFQQRVLGQPEAVDCLVERVAMIKTGLTDPSRPSGVFLFAGPTGTGKTEIAKTLAEFLFGSSDRMIRLDMSEYQTPDALDSILGDRSDQWRTEGTSSLFTQIRKQPFSVILLDEFEKAHPRIWDLFLQVFDDGRLTDRSGNTANFRNSIIVLTTNLGSKIQAGESIGFSPSLSTFSVGSVEKAIRETFRREFINRLDRVVIFRPLSRKVMREILWNELKTVLTRRGLRMREWAIEWEDSALEFLLERGFTPDLGARPLKRAIERYLLSPLAMTMINHQVPEGDQFLFIRSDGHQIEVEFIDPDAVEEVSGILGEVVEEPDLADDIRLTDIILEAGGTSAEVAVLKRHHQTLSGDIHNEAWAERKGSDLDQTNLSGFWEDEKRFGVLGEIEYMERVENGLRTADSLLNRLLGNENCGKNIYSPELVTRLAEQLYLLEKAYETVTQELPREAFLRLETQQISRGNDDMVKEFFAKICLMYQKWAARRRMRLQVLEEKNDEGPYRFIASVTGFGSFSILQEETGFHVWEKPRPDQNSFRRCRVTVNVISQPDKPAPSLAALREQAEEGLKKVKTTALKVIRHYREAPSPLVRDQAQNWRTGRLDRVLDGNFDLFHSP